jgi:hypothetical protein
MIVVPLAADGAEDLWVDTLEGKTRWVIHSPGVVH